MVEKYGYNKKMNESFLRKRGQRQKQTREWPYFNFFKTAFFGHILKKKQHIHFWVHGHCSWSTFGLHLVKGPKALYIVLL